MASSSPTADVPTSRLRQLLARLADVVNELRRRSLATRRRAVCVGVGAVTVLGATIFAWTMIARSVADPPVAELLAAALEALDSGRWEKARSIVQKVNQRQGLSTADYGGPPFVLGVCKANEAQEDFSDQRRKESYLIAASYLQEARTRHFPKGRKAAGLLWLGKSLLGAEKYDDAAPVLEEALPLNPQAATDVHRMLTIAYANARENDLLAAKQHSEMELNDRTLAPHDRAGAILRRGDILLRIGDVDAAQTLVDQLPAELLQRPPAKLLQARLLMAKASDIGSTTAEGDQSPSPLSVALSLLREIQAESSQDSPLSRSAMYLIAQCYSRLPGETDAALDQFFRVRKLFPDSEEGLAASLAEARLLHEQSRLEDAVTAYRRTLRAAGDPKEYHNRWISLAHLREQLLEARDSFIDNGQFDAALSLLEQFPPTFDEEATLEQQADLWSRWGERLLQESSFQPAGEAEASARQGRTYFRRAGRGYEELSQRRFSRREYPDDLWKAAESYMNGHSFSHAIRLMETYLAREAIARRPLALVKLGQAYLASGVVDRSIAALEECIELYDRDATVYKARVLCASAYQEKGDIAQSERLLRANLTANGLTPESREWRESLLALGQLYQSEGRYQDAITALQEYVERYGGESEVLLARYLVAQSYRHAAFEPLDKLAQAITENERLKHRTNAEQLLTAAVNHFSYVQRTLTLQSAESDLEPLEQAILRNCYLLRGDVFFSMKEYEKALEVFRNASSLYQNDPVVLDAYLQIAWCHRRLGQLQEARGAIEQAKIVLARLPQAADFTVATGFDRQQWGRVLDAMSQW